MRLLAAAGASENAFRVALKSQERSKLPPERPSVSLRSPKSSRKCWSGLLRSCLTLSNAARACSGAACALETAACASPKAARSLEKLVRASSATALLSNYCSKVLLEVTVRSHMSLQRCTHTHFPQFRLQSAWNARDHTSIYIYPYIHISTNPYIHVSIYPYFPYQYQSISIHINPFP